MDVTASGGSPSPAKRQSSRGTLLLVFFILLLSAGLLWFINHTSHQQTADLKAAEQRWQAQGQKAKQGTISGDLDIAHLAATGADIKGDLSVTGTVNIDGALTVNGQTVPGPATGSSAGQTTQQTIVNQTVVQSGGGGTSLPANVTLQGNSFNGAGQLVQLDSSARLPAVDGSQLTGVNADTLNGQPGSFYQNASNINTGTLGDARLSSNVALLNRNSQVFMGNNQKFQNAADSTTAFQVQNAAGTSNLLVADTVNNRLAVGQAAAAYTLDVAGDINTSTGYRVGGTAGATTTCGGGQFLQNQVVLGGITTGGTCAGASGGGVTTVGALDGQTKSANGAVISGTTIYLQTADGSNPGLVSTGIQTLAGAKTFTSSLTVNVAGGSATALQVLDGSGGSVLTVDSSSSAARAVLGGVNKGDSILQLQRSGVTKYAIGSDSNSLGGSDGLFFYNYTDNAYVAALRNNGSAWFQNSTNSANGFVVQNAAGTQQLLTVNTLNNRVAIAQASATYTLDVAGDINSTTGYRTNGTVGITGTCSGGQFLQNASVRGGILTGGACASGGGGGTLQGAYDSGNSITTTDNRDVVFNLANTTTDSNFIINMLTGTASKFQVQANGTPTFSIGPTGAVAFQNSVDSTSAFQIQNSSGGAPLLKADTVNATIGIGVSPTSTGGALQVGGAVTISQFNPTTFTTPNGAGVNTQINIPVSSQGAFSQLLAFGIDSGSADNSRVLSVFDARTVAHQPSLGVFSVNESNIVGFSWEGGSSIAYLKTTGGDLGLRSGTTDLLTLSSSGQLGLTGNARGINVAIGSGASSVGITFPNAYAGSNYAVQCTPSYNTTCYITGKSTTGFTINFGTAAPDANQTVDWFVVR